MATLANFFEVKWGAHRPKACVSAEEKAEEARCYGGTFESWVERWIFFFLQFLGDVGTHRPKARVSAVGKAEEARDF